MKQPCKCGRRWVAKWNDRFSYRPYCPGCGQPAVRCTCVSIIGTPGHCRICGCTEDRACAGGCSWTNPEKTLCSNPSCQIEAGWRAAGGN